MTIPAPPWHFGGHDDVLTPQTPAHQGEHNEEMLKELGYTDDQVRVLVQSGALIEPAHEILTETES